MKPKKKLPMWQEMDLTRDGVAEMTRWCIIIALHQGFGVGAQRLQKLETRAEELGHKSLTVAMTANGRGMPSTDKSREMRESWMPEGVEPEFPVPVLRMPRNRREQELRQAGNVAAGMVWTLYARACAEVLGRKAAPAGAAVMSREEMDRRIAAVQAQSAPRSWERRRKG